MDTTVLITMLMRTGLECECLMKGKQETLVWICLKCYYCSCIDRVDRKNKVHVYQIQNVQVIFQHKTLHGSLKICKYSQSFRRGEG